MTNESSSLLRSTLQALYAAWPEDDSEAMAYKCREVSILGTLTARARKGDTTALQTVKEFQHPLNPML